MSDRLVRMQVVLVSLGMVLAIVLLGLVVVEQRQSIDAATDVLDRLDTILDDPRVVETRVERRDEHRLLLSEIRETRRLLVEVCAATDGCEPPD